MDSECSSSYRVLELNSSNYLLWRSRILLEISSREAMEAVETDLEFVSDKNRRKLDTIASRIINSNIGLADSERILFCRSAYQKWKYLEDKYQKSASNRTLELLVKYMYHLPTSGSWVDILLAQREILDQLDLIYRLNTGEAAEKTVNKIKCDLFMLKLPPNKFQPVISAFQALSDDQKKFNKLFDDAMVIAQGSNGGSVERNIGFVTTRRKTMIKCWRCGRIGH
ncbi:hypothetical protein SSS_08565 [Sarcoptes scabiei]|uniref:Uncharacterized protein n=1 Tax=Sarcoptes scabiei TaxID=52283 RepID=A0A834RIF1_SARSC|nr:hypothetical protein SSS_08565 [Sarcoptes scabiei]